MRVLALDGSPQGGGRTAAVLGAILEGAVAAEASGAVLGLADPQERAAALVAAEDADAFVVGSPVYRASFAAPLKAFLDELPRGMWGETTAPITARAVAIACTGATWHHYLALDALRNVLSGFFGAHVLAPGLYVPGEGFADGALSDEFADLARRTGRGLVDLAGAVGGSAALREVRPQA